MGGVEDGLKGVLIGKGGRGAVVERVAADVVARVCQLVAT